LNGPFNEARYRALLEGLEITVLSLSDVRKGNAKLRIDSAYFGKDVMRLDALVRGFRTGFVELGETARIFRKGIFDIKANSYTEKGVPFIRISNLRDGNISEASIAYISADAHACEAKTEVRRGDLAISKTAYPAVSYVQVVKANVSQDIIAYKMKAEWRKTLRSGFLAAYLNSPVGIALMQRQFQGNVQLHLSLDDGRKVPVPLMSEKLQEFVENDSLRAFDQIRASAGKLVEAEQMLLEELNLANWNPPHPLAYSHNNRDAFAAGRLDAEYFAPRVASLLLHLGLGGSTVGDVAPARHERFFPGTREDFEYIEIENLRADGTTVAERRPSNEAPSRATWHVRAGDIVTSTVRPIRRLSALITVKQDGFVCSSGFVVLRPRSTFPEVLLTYLRLPQVCELMELHTSASMYPAISERDLLAIPFPSISEKSQTEIVAAVRHAHESQTLAQELLEAAKTAVEIAVEDSEDAALKFLSDAREG